MMVNRLEEAIKSRNMTLRGLSIKSGVSKSTISRLISDKTAGVGMESGLRICKALGADPRDIFLL